MDADNETPAEEFLIPYLREFVDRRLDELKELREGNEVQDFPRVKKIAHNWAGVSKPYGCESLAKVARDIERLAEERNSSQISEVASEVKDYLDKKKSNL